MQKPIRRKDRILQVEEAVEVLKNAEYGVLSMTDGDGEPYGIPLSFVYHEGALFFHCAQEGQKIDNINRDDRVCFVAVGATQVISDQFTTRYQSALVRGRAKIIEGEAKRLALLLLCRKYCPDDMDKADTAIENSFQRTCVVQIRIDSMTGKAKR